MSVRQMRVMHLPPLRNPVAPTVQTSRQPVQLSPIPWGKPDPKLAKGLHQHISDATGPIVIPFDRRTHHRLRRALRSLGIHY